MHVLLVGTCFVCMSGMSLYNIIYLHADNEGFYHWCCGRIRHFYTAKTRMRLKIELDDFALMQRKSPLSIKAAGS